MPRAGRLLEWFRSTPSSGVSPTMVEALAQPQHAGWQALCQKGQVIDAIREARELGLDLGAACDLVEAYRAQEGLLPRKARRWWFRS